MEILAESLDILLNIAQNIDKQLNSAENRFYKKGDDPMNEKIIITIARQFGSGGREIGQKLAERLGISFYDKELITRAAKESGIDQDLFENADEKPFNPFWSSVAVNLSGFSGKFTNFSDMPINDRLFLIQTQVIKQIAEEDSCVIVGRCADHILRDRKDAVHVFLLANDDYKLKRVVESYGVPQQNAAEFMHKTDKKRAAYYDYYVGEKWGNAQNYDLSVRTSSVGIDHAVDLILHLVKMKLHR